MSVTPITIYPDLKIKIGDGWINSANVGQFARDDGFESVNEFHAFFESHYGLPFEGELIKW